MLIKMSPIIVTLFLVLSLNTDSGNSRAKMNYSASLNSATYLAPPIDLDSPILKPGAILDTYLNQKKIIDNNIIKARSEQKFIISQQRVIEKQVDSISKKIDTINEAEVNSDSLLNNKNKKSTFSQWLNNIFRPNKKS